MGKNILFINHETAPYSETTECAVIGRELPEAIQAKGLQLRTFNPKWGNISDRKGQLHEVIRLSGLDLDINDADHQILIKVASTPVTRLQVYFIDNSELYARRMLEADEEGNEYADNGDRAVFYARAVLETVKKLRWIPDVVVCQSWMGAAVPFYLKKVFNEEPCYAETKVVVALFEEKLKNGFGKNFKNTLLYKDVNEEYLAQYTEEFTTKNIQKFAIDFADAVAVCSENADAEVVDYAKEKGLPVVDCKGSKQINTLKEFLISL